MQGRFTIRRHEDNRFVTEPGRPQSYSRDSRSARRFQTREAAQADCCGNEYVWELMD